LNPIATESALRGSRIPLHFLATRTETIDA
jgi:hypothetical protein